jgi:hypothetical protein
MDDAPGNRRFRDLVCDIAQGFGVYKDVAADVAAGFDLPAAVGAQLDAIGSVLGLPRAGFGDARYRTFLEIQVDLILSANREGGNWTGTHNNLLKIVRTFIGSTPGQIIHLKTVPPKSYTITIPGIVLTELPTLLHFLALAQYSEVLGQITVLVINGTVWGSSQVAVPDAGVWGSSQVAVPGAPKWSFSLPIGSP